MQRSDKGLLIAGVALMTLACLPAYSQASSIAGRLPISSDVTAPSQVLDLDKYAFADASFSSSGSFPHRITFGSYEFPFLTYISITEDDRKTSKIAIAATVPGINDYFDVTDNEPHSILVSLILDRQPRIRRDFRLSVHRQAQYIANQLVTPISFNLNFIFKDKNGTQHHVMLMSNRFDNYIRDNFDNAVPEFGCIIDPAVFDLWWDDIRTKIIFVLASSSYNDNEIFSYTEDRSCGGEYPKKHNSLVADVDGDGGIFATSSLLYLANRHDVFSFPISWLDPTRQGRNSIVVDADKVKAALRAKTASVMQDRNWQNRCRPQMLDCVQSVVDETILAIAGGDAPKAARH